MLYHFRWRLVFVSHVLTFGTCLRLVILKKVCIFSQCIFWIADWSVVLIRHGGYGYFSTGFSTFIEAEMSKSGKFWAMDLWYCFATTQQTHSSFKYFDTNPTNDKRLAYQTTKWTLGSLFVWKGGTLEKFEIHWKMRVQLCDPCYLWGYHNFFHIMVASSRGPTRGPLLVRYGTCD